ncbi:MAG: deoxyribodipyrimidine photo-lyase [Pseudomonadota bacterium]
MADSDPITLLWFRQDLRISDNPALVRAAETGNLLPIYILDDINAADWAMGGASRVWLHHSLAALNESLNNRMQFFVGDARQILDHLTDSLPIQAIHWNRCYEPWRISRDRLIKQDLRDKGLAVKSYNGSLLFEPWTIKKKDGEPYRVFTPFFRNAYSRLLPRTPARCPHIDFYQHPIEFAKTLKDLHLLPQHSWGKTVMSHWQAGERAAQARLNDFLDSNLNDYAKARDYPAEDGTSRLSPYLHFGEISPDQICYRLQQPAGLNGDETGFAFIRQLIWREFSHHLLYQFPQLPDTNFQSRFNHMETSENQDDLEKWQSGNTGFPIIDAGMRELRQTGYMHNRIRMLVASFLTKNLGQSWRAGARWFWDNLVEADLANNSAGWQWCAGSGADAAPYFRVFNPLLQSEKFDKQGAYLLRYCPELGNLPFQSIHQPWYRVDRSQEESITSAEIGYPKPMIDLKASREAALARYKTLGSNEIRPPGFL